MGAAAGVLPRGPHRARPGARARRCAARPGPGRRRHRPRRAHLRGRAGPRWDGPDGRTGGCAGRGGRVHPPGPRPRKDDRGRSRDGRAGGRRARGRQRHSRARPRLGRPARPRPRAPGQPRRRARGRARLPPRAGADGVTPPRRAARRACRPRPAGHRAAVRCGPRCRCSRRRRRPDRDALRAQPERRRQPFARRGDRSGGRRAGRRRLNRRIGPAHLVTARGPSYSRAVGHTRFRREETMRRRRRLAFALPLVIVVALVLALGVSTGSARSHRQTDAFKAAWIYVGPHDDHGWSQAHDKGRLYVQNALGSKVQTTYKELVPEGPQTCQVIESLVRDGNKIIFATSFGFQNCMVTEAKKHSDVFFEQATGTAQAKNLAEYFGAAEDAIYLSGMAAGAASKKGVIGYVVPFAIPEVIRHAHAFAPKQWLTAAVYNWGPYYLRRVKAAMNGTWKSGFYYGNLNDKFVGLAPYGPKVTAKTKRAIAKKMAALKKGTFYEFTGPLYDQKGKLRVPKGKRLTVKDLYAMNWLVKGVIGSARG